MAAINPDQTIPTDVTDDRPYSPSDPSFEFSSRKYSSLPRGMVLKKGSTKVKGGDQTCAAATGGASTSVGVQGSGTGVCVPPPPPPLPPSSLGLSSVSSFSGTQGPSGPQILPSSQGQFGPSVSVGIQGPTVPPSPLGIQGPPGPPGFSPGSQGSRPSVSTFIPGTQGLLGPQVVSPGTQGLLGPQVVSQGLFQNTGLPNPWFDQWGRPCYSQPSLFDRSARPHLPMQPYSRGATAAPSLVSVTPQLPPLDATLQAVDLLYGRFPSAPAGGTSTSVVQGSMGTAAPPSVVASQPLPPSSIPQLDSNAGTQIVTPAQASPSAAQAVVSLLPHSSHTVGSSMHSAGQTSGSLAPPASVNTDPSSLGAPPFPGGETDGDFVLASQDDVESLEEGRKHPSVFSFEEALSILDELDSDAVVWSADKPACNSELGDKLGFAPPTEEKPMLRESKMLKATLEGLYAQFAGSSSNQAQRAQAQVIQPDPSTPDASVSRPFALNVGTYLKVPKVSYGPGVRVQSSSLPPGSIPLVESDKNLVKDSSPRSDTSISDDQLKSFEDASRKALFSASILDRFLTGLLLALKDPNADGFQLREFVDVDEILVLSRFCNSALLDIFNQAGFLYGNSILFRRDIVLSSPGLKLRSDAAVRTIRSVPISSVGLFGLDTVKALSDEEKRVLQERALESVLPRGGGRGRTPRRGFNYPRPGKAGGGGRGGRTTTRDGGRQVQSGRNLQRVNSAQSKPSGKPISKRTARRNSSRPRQTPQLAKEPGTGGEKQKSG